MTTLAPSGRLIVALDVNTEAEALELIEELGSSVSFYKVGLQLFMGTHFDVVSALSSMEKKVFLDIKIEDIPNTIELALKNTPKADFIELITLQGASQMIEAAKKGVNGGGKPKFLMLTVLSSLNDSDIHEMHGDEESVDGIVNRRAEKAISVGCDGLIASGDSVRNLRTWIPENCMIVAPGIRMKGASVDDHKRTLMPFEAIRDGADFIVVGRPIRDAPNKKEMAEEFIEEIDKGQAERDRLMRSHDSHSDDFTYLLEEAVSNR